MPQRGASYFPQENASYGGAVLHSISIHADRAIGYYCTTELFFKNKKQHILTPVRAHFTFAGGKLFTSSLNQRSR